MKLKKSDLEYLSPFPSKAVMFFASEAIIYLPRTGKSQYFIGIGQVRKVEENAVYLTFGITSKFKHKKVRVELLTAKKQLICLKCNQFCLVYGISNNIYKGDLEALCFFPSFVPNRFDRQQILADSENEIETEKDDILERFKL